MRKIVILLALISLASCMPKKVFIDRQVHDTLIVTKEIIKTLPVNNYIEIDKPCDSLGNLRNSILNLDSGKAKIRVIMRDNIIRVEANIDSIQQSAVDSFKSTYKADKVVVEKAYIPTWIKLSLLLNLALLLFTFRKLIFRL